MLGFVVVLVMDTRETFLSRFWGIFGHTIMNDYEIKNGQQNSWHKKKLVFFFFAISLIEITSFQSRC